MENGSKESPTLFFQKGLDTDQAFDVAALTIILDSMKEYLSFRLCDLPKHISSNLGRIREIVRLFRLSPKYSSIYEIIINRYPNNYPLGTLGFYLSNGEKQGGCVSHISQYSPYKDVAIPRPNDPITPSSNIIRSSLTEKQRQNLPSNSNDERRENNQNNSDNIVPVVSSRDLQAVFLVIYPNNYDTNSPTYLLSDTHENIPEILSQIVIVPLNNMNPNNSLKVYHCGYVSDITAWSVKQYLQKYRANMTQYIVTKDHQVKPYTEVTVSNLNRQQIKSINAGTSGMSSNSSSTAIWWWIGIAVIILLLVIFIWWYLMGPISPTSTGGRDLGSISPTPTGGKDLGPVEPSSSVNGYSDTIFVTTI